MVDDSNEDLDESSVQLLDPSDDDQAPVDVVTNPTSQKAWPRALAVGVVGALSLVVWQSSDGLITEPPAEPATPVSLAPPRVTTVPPSTLPNGELLVGEQTDLWLFYGGEDPLQRLDLDTGEFVTFGIRVNPVVATGSSLVVSTAQPDDLISWVQLENPGEQPQVWKAGRIAQAADDGDVWIYEDVGPDGTPLWTRFSTDEHEIAERRSPLIPLDSADGVGRARALISGPDLVGDGESIFEYVDDNYERLGPGSVLYYDKGHALTLQCPDETCFVQWVARATWEPFAFPTPYDPPADVELLAQASWIYLVSESEPRDDVSGAVQPGSETSLSGRTIELLPTFVFGSYYFNEGTAVNISADGRWMAWETQDGSVELRNLTTDKSYDLPYFDRAGTGSLLFVEKGRLR